MTPVGERVKMKESVETQGTVCISVPRLIVFASASGRSPANHQALEVHHPSDRRLQR